MKQRNLSYEILLVLQKGEKHQRELARLLNETQPRVGRILNKLIEDNLLDIKKVGKNNIYFLKNTIETKETIKILEHYKVLKLVSQWPNLRKLIQFIQNSKKIKKAIIFGSYAKFRATKNSDIDLYLDSTDSQLKNEIELLSEKVSLQTGKISKENPLFTEILNNHIILKGSI